MKENIIILKNIIEQDFSNPMGWSGYYDSELKELQQAIKNLIKAYKELEEKQKSYNTAYNQGKAFEKHRWKSLVEEKIEELKKCGNDWIIQREVQVLQELLEKRK